MVCVCLSFLFFFSEKETDSFFFHIFICCFPACGQIGVLSKMFFKKKRLKKKHEYVLDIIMKYPQIKDVEEEAY